MDSNTFGRRFRLTTFGESHGPAIGGVIDGCPAGLPLDASDIQTELDRRKPGQGTAASTSRKEADAVRLLSGVFEGRTTGCPIGFVIENTDQRSKDYGPLATAFRPGHADATFQAKYGLRDYRGGGRSSARETACRVVGGAVAAKLIALFGIEVTAYPVEIAGLSTEKRDLSGLYERPFFTPDPDMPPLWEDALRQARSAGDSVGGIVEIVSTGLEAGLGDPVFDKLDARLAYAFMGIGAVKGVEIGDGFAAARSRGSINNDARDATGYLSNHAGGILGGLSSGQDLVARVAVKPIPSIASPQKTVDMHGQELELVVGGRHDCCAIPRIVPVLRAMCCLCLADFALLSLGDRLPGSLR